MFSEDKLTADQRIRLESLNQANLALHMASFISQAAKDEHLIYLARELEKYIRDGGPVAFEKRTRTKTHN